MRGCLLPTISPISLTTMFLGMGNGYGSASTDLDLPPSKKMRVESSKSVLEGREAQIAESRSLNGTTSGDHVVVMGHGAASNTAPPHDVFGSVGLKDVLFGEATFDDLFEYLRHDDDYVPLEAIDCPLKKEIDCLLEGESGLVGVRPEDVLTERPIPSFEVAAPCEQGLRLPAKYWKLAYDILEEDWRHLVPFDIAGLTVFGLAKKIKECEGNEEVNFMLTTRRYTLERGEWDSRELQARLNSGYFNTEVLREEAVHKIAPERANDVIEELLLRWPMFSLEGSITSRMRFWFRTRGWFFSPASNGPYITDRELESLLLKKAAFLRVPLTEVPKAIRREQRRRRIREAAQVQGEAVNDSIPEFLVNRWGHKFQIATVDEARLRISPSCLVWAYDVKKYGWWSTVPKGIDPIGMSVFGLAKAVEGIRKLPYTLSASCYSCTEHDTRHRNGNGCERCESHWDLVEFWEWLRSRHFCEAREIQSDSVIAHEIVNSIGFAPPRRNGARRVVSPWVCDPTLFCKTSQTMKRRMTGWWSWSTRATDQSSDGLCQWEFERILLYRLAELDRLSGRSHLLPRTLQGLGKRNLP